MPNALRQVIVAAIAYVVWRGILSLAGFDYQLFRDPFSFPGLLVDFAVLAIALVGVELALSALLPSGTVAGSASAQPDRSTESSGSAPRRKAPSKKGAGWTQVLVAGDIQKQMKEEAEAAATSEPPAEPARTAPRKKTPSKSDASWTQVLVAGDVRKKMAEEAKRQEEEAD